MYVTYDTIITAGAVLGALSAFGALAWKLFKWVNHQKEQDSEIEKIKENHAKEMQEIRDAHTKEMQEIKDAHKKDIEELKKKHDHDIKEIKTNSDTTIQAIQEEQTLVVYGLLACLKGLNEQGCDGPVAEAIDKIDKHLNKRAHSQI